MADKGEKLAEALHAIEDNAITKFNKEFQATVRKTLSETDWSDIESRLEAQQDAEEVAYAVTWQGYDPRTKLEEDVFPAASGIMANYIADVVATGTKASFTLTDPNALKWLKDYGAKEVKYVSDSQKDAIKQIVTDGYANGVTYQTQAKQIRNCIGLDPRRASILQKYSENLFAKGKSEEEVWRLMEKKGKALLNKRAQDIAVQEAITAGARAFYETTKDACKRSILDPNIYEGYRIVTGDDRLCKTCAELVGEARRLPDGSYPSSGDVTPKLHLLCRCVEGIRRISMKKTEMKDAERSNEYLGKFLELVKPWILPDKWQEFHKAARGFAGGKGRAARRAESQESDEITIEAIQVGPGIARRKARNGINYIVSPVHLTHEGVANGILKRWEEIYDPEEIDGVHSFEGCMITRGHPILGMGPETPSLGKLRNIVCDTEEKRADAEAWLVEERLTGKEVKALESGEPVAGSLAYNSRKIYLPAPLMWDDGTPYDTEVKRPFRANHYALLDESDTPACPTCGFNAPPPEIMPPPDTGKREKVNVIDFSKSESETELVLEDGSVKRRTCGKCKQEDDNSMPIDATEMKKLFKESFEESVGPLVKRIEALEKATSGDKPLAEDPTIKTLIENVSKLTESLPDIQGFKAQQEAAKLTTQRESFAKQLNAAHTKDGKPEGETFERVWAEASKDPLGRDHYLGEHPEIRLQPGRENDFKGRAAAGAESDDFDIAAENKKLYGY